jgi:hypothetical protein
VSLPIRFLSVALLVFLQSLSVFASIEKDLIDPFTLPTMEESKSKLLKNITTLSLWSQIQNQKQNEFLCLGEMHDNNYRALAAKVFSQIKFQNLILEANDGEIEQFKVSLKNQDSFKHLGADFNPVLEAAFTSNPNLNLFGAENKGVAVTDRDVALARYISSTINLAGPFKKTVALYGHLHCSRLDLGLGQSVPFFQHLERNLKVPKFKNVRIIIPSFKVEPQLLSLIARLQIKEPLIVLKNPRDIDPLYYRYNAELLHLFQNFDDLIIDTRFAQGEN